MTRPLHIAILALAAACSCAQANQFSDMLKEQMGKSGLGSSMPSLGGNTMGNAAGVIQYCVKNNYLSADKATAVKDRLLGMVTGQKAQQTGYANGAKGLLMGEDGKSLNLKGLSSKLKEKACDYVLQNATSLL